MQVKRSNLSLPDQIYELVSEAIQEKVRISVIVKDQGARSLDVGFDSEVSIGEDHITVVYDVSDREQRKTVIPFSALVRVQKLG